MYISTNSTAYKVYIDLASALDKYSSDESVNNFLYYFCANNKILELRDNKIKIIEYDDKSTILIQHNSTREKFGYNYYIIIAYSLEPPYNRTARKYSSDYIAVDEDELVDITARKRTIS